MAARGGTGRAGPGSSTAQGQAGGQARAALESVTESVAHLRAPALEDPGAFVSDLARSLNNLSEREEDAGGPPGGSPIADRVIAEFAAGPAAELLAARARLRWLDDDRPNALGYLRSAAYEAQRTEDPEWTGRARVAVRTTAQGIREEGAEDPSSTGLLQYAEILLAPRGAGQLTFPS
ncbi:MULTISPECIES: hypothetical protein [unclassified Kitasatospora]|uniref:hypothetical protein n=1 Tax=unclassified Kitasatospora TaxID=2633591 RepID=UPI0033C1E2CE